MVFLSPRDFYLEASAWSFTGDLSGQSEGETLK